jgi:hypothetical protein
MKRLSLAIIALLLLSAGVRAQSGFVQVHSVVLDPSGTPYANCSGNASFVPSPSATQVPTIGGSTFPTTAVIASCDSFGAFNLTLADNNFVVDGHTSPPASQWQFNILAQAGTPGFACTLTITGITQDISAQIQACAAPLPATGGGNVFAFSVVQQSATPSFVGNQDTVFSFLLNQSVTSSTFITNAKPGTSPIYYINICQDNVGGRTMVWPSNVTLPANYVFSTAPNACSPVAFAYNPNTATWSPWMNVNATGGGGGTTVSLQTNGVVNPSQTVLNIKNGTGIGVASDGSGGVTVTNTGSGVSSGNAGVAQASNGASGFQPMLISDANGLATIAEDLSTKGPNPNIDVRQFGARDLPINNSPNNGGPTGTISSGSQTLTLSANVGGCSASSQCYFANDGIDVLGAGANNTAPTPSAPTITPCVATGPTMTGHCEAAPAGALSQCVQIADLDNGYGITASTTEVCTATGQPLGAVSTNITSCTRTNAQVTCPTSTNTLTNHAFVYIHGTNDDLHFGFWGNLASATSTSITYNTKYDTRYGAPTSSTGGTVTQFNMLDILLPAYTGTQLQHVIFEGTTGAEVYVGLTPPALSGSTDTSLLHFQYMGIPVPATRPYYVPNTPPSSATPDILVTKVTTVAGSVLGIRDPATNSVAGAATRIDFYPALLAAAQQQNSQGGMIYIPAPQTCGNVYAINSFASINQTNHSAISSAATIVANGTLSLTTTKLTGSTNLNPCAMTAPGFALESYTTITGLAYPTVWLNGGGGSIRDMTVTNNNSSGLSLLDSTGNTSAYSNFTASTGGLHGIAFYRLSGNTSSGDFGFKCWNCSWLSTQDAQGSNATPSVITKNTGYINVDRLSMDGHGLYVDMGSQGSVNVHINMDYESQGPTMPMFAVGGSNGNLSGWFHIEHAVDDSGGTPIIASYAIPGGTFGGSAELNYSNVIGSFPVIGGNGFASLLVHAPNIPVGQNVDVISTNGGTSSDYINKQVFMAGPTSQVGVGQITTPAVAPTASQTTGCNGSFPAAGTYTYSVIFFDEGMTNIFFPWSGANSGGIQIWNHATTTSPSSGNVTLNGTSQCALITEPTPPNGAVYWWPLRSGEAPVVSLITGGTAACGFPNTVIGTPIPVGTTQVFDASSHCVSAGPSSNSTSLSGIQGGAIWSNTYNILQYVDVTETSVPANPATGFERWYSNAITHQLSCILPSGASCIASGIGTGNQNCLTDWATTSALGTVCSSIAGQVAVANNGSPPTFLSPAMIDSPNSPVVTTPYLIACDNASTIIDRTKTIRFQAGASAITIPLSSGSGCLGLVTTVFDDEAGALTFTRSSPDTLTIVNGSTALDAQTSFTLANGQYATLSQNATGLWLVRVAIGASAGVSSFTGDGAFLSNSASTGAVTATLAPAAANKVWGNCTTSSGTPTYCSISLAMLPTGIPNANLANPSTTVNTQTCTLGSSCTVTYANIPAGALANGTTATTQSAGDTSTDVATDQFVNTAVSNAIAAVNPAVAVLAATIGSNLTGTYSNGASGIGATFTITATGAFTLDGVAINTIGQRVLLKDQTSGFQNGVYTATIVGTTGISPVFTRALDYDQPSDINTTGAIPVQSGTVNASTSWLLTSTVNTVGTDALTYVQFSIAPSNIVTQTSNATTNQVCTYTGANKICVPALVAAANMNAQYSKGSCTELWGGSGTSFALTSGDDAISNNSCYNDSGVTRTITAVKCRSDNASNTTTVNPTFGASGTGTTILSGALTCGSSLAYSSSGTVSNASWTTGTGITPAMAGTLTGTSIAMIVEYTF